MKVSDLVNELGLKIYAGQDGLDKNVSGGYVSDLLSDVMGNSDSGMVWVTLQTHKNVMAIASLKDLSAIILVKGLKPDDDMAAQADIEGVPVLGTDNQAFEIAGRLYGIIGK